CGTRCKNGASREGLSRRPASARDERRCAAHRRRERRSGSDRSWPVGNFAKYGRPAYHQSQSQETPNVQKQVGGLLLPGALPNRAYVPCLGGSSECNGIIVSTCEWPVTAEPYRAKTAPLPRSSILVRPHRLRSRKKRRGNGGGAGNSPRVRNLDSTPT